MQLDAVMPGPVIPVPSDPLGFSRDAAPATSERVVLPSGIPGFPDATRYRLEPLPTGGDHLLRLRSLDPEGPSFLVVADGGGEGLIDAADREEGRRAIGARAAEAVILFVATLAREADGTRLFVNRRAPIFIDADSRTGAQVVLQRPGYGVRHPIVAADRAGVQAPR